MSVDLNKLDSMLDASLNKETSESLNEWLEAKEPLFTLTAEEVALLPRLIDDEWRRIQVFIDKWGEDPEVKEWIIKRKKDVKVLQNLLTRIEQWQDENRTD